MTDQTIKMVEEFHRTYSMPIAHEPQVPTKKRQDLRIELLEEELIELKEAFSENDIVAVFDALLDLQYVLDGTFCECGMHKHKMKGITEVHRSNMSKLGEDGTPIYREDGKVLKGPNYSKPNLVKVLLESTYGDSAIERVVRTSCDAFKIPIEKLHSYAKSKAFAEARNAICVITRDEFNLSFPEIGRILQRDHTTCMESYHRGKRLLKSSKAFALKVVEIQNQLGI